MQKTFKNKQGRDFLFQTLAEGATDIKLDHGGIYYTYDKDLITETNCYKRIRNKGNYQILCLAKDATEEQAAMVVDLTRVECEHVPSIKYKNYHEKNGMRYNYATCSLTSLLTSLGFKQDDNVLILEKI